MRKIIEQTTLKKQKKQTLTEHLIWEKYNTEFKTVEKETRNHIDVIDKNVNPIVKKKKIPIRLFNDYIHYIITSQSRLNPPWVSASILQ